jgi:hypothetical protein
MPHTGHVPGALATTWPIGQAHTCAPVGGDEAVGDGDDEVTERGGGAQGDSDAAGFAGSSGPRGGSAPSAQPIAKTAITEEIRPRDTPA